MNKSNHLLHVSNLSVKPLKSLKPDIYLLTLKPTDPQTLSVASCPLN